ncbi:MAG: GSCFA domain-containing protein [Bacteroidota bacterium]
MGSCFADRMGDRLAQAQFSISVNPLGIAYHPIALAQLLDWTAEPSLSIKPQYAEHLQQWHHFGLHTRFNQEQKATFVQTVQAAHQMAHQAFVRCDRLILTLGTAMGHRHLAQRQVVNNCHRYPAATFQKGLVPLEEMKERLEVSLLGWKKARPELEVLLTVSPIRHLRDTLPLNSVSKASLRLLCHQLVQSWEWMHYFPAYELMMDDLREYRFYEADMLHPNAVAEQYIWEKLVETHCEAPTQAALKQWETIARDLQHRSRQPGSEAHRRFLNQLLTRLEALPSEIPCQPEMIAVRKQLRLFEA